VLPIDGFPQVVFVSIVTLVRRLRVSRHLKHLAATTGHCKTIEHGEEMMQNN
jgi:hypothetical protein